MNGEVVNNSLDLATIIAIVLIINFAASWLVFAQFSMRPLEKKLRAINKDTISHWDGPGWRVATYAIKLVLPPSIWGEYAMFIDPYLLREISTRNDRLLAIWMMGSAIVTIVFSVIYVEFL